MPKSQNLILAAIVCLFVCTASPAANDPQNDKISLSPEMVVDRVVVKFRENAEVRMRGGMLTSLAGVDLSRVNDRSKSHQLKPLFVRGESILDQEFELLKSTGLLRVQNKNSYFKIEVSDPREAEQLVRKYSDLPYVEYCYAEPKPEPAGDIPPTTPDYTASQGYLFSPPGGIAADSIWKVAGGTGVGVNIIDIEGDWNPDHEDFAGNVGSILAGIPVEINDWIQHGTAVTGIIAADSNEYGVTGIAFDAEIDYVSIGDMGVAEAVDAAASNLDPGDIMLLELHTPGPRYDFVPTFDKKGYVPVEYFDANFDAIQMASANGIIVVAVAGNGWEDLDDPIYEGRFDRSFRDSRAIIVGAGAPPNGQYGPDRSRLYFSNYGSRVDLQGWGKSVYTAGYGSIFNGDGDTNQYYTEAFGGTSAAAPMIAGAVATLQGVFQALHGATMTAEAVRALLANTGTPQSNPDEWIGSRPNLGSALDFLPSAGITSNPLAVIDTVLHGQDTARDIWLINRDTSDAIPFAITIDDDLEGGPYTGWMQASPLSGTVPAGDSISIVVDLLSGFVTDTTDTHKGLIKVGHGEWTSLRIPVFFTVKCNDSSYQVIRSDQSGEIDFEWVDITGIGTRIPDSAFHNYARPVGYLDDGTSSQIPLGFVFNFYNSFFEHIYAGVNGALSFDSDEIDYDGYFNEMPLPRPGIPALLIPFWNDLTMDEAGNGHGEIYYYSAPTGDSLVIEYSETASFDSEGDSLITFEVILTSDNRITFQYLNVGNSGLEQSALVGISLDDGCRMVNHCDLSNPIEHMPSDSLRIDFIPLFEFFVQSGDVNNSSAIDIDDIVYLIAFVFTGGPDPIPPPAGDCNCSGGTDIDDIVYLIAYVFQGGPAPCGFEL